jgi:type I restriction enzyme S subunit
VGVWVRVFGSRAKWTAKPFSDLDLGSKRQRELPRGMVDLADAFEESDRRFRVDIVDWHTVAPGFQAVIDRDGVVIVPSLEHKWIEYKFGDLTENLIHGVNR